MRTATPKASHAGPRGLSKDAIAEAAIALMESTGEDGFSLRKLGDRVGCDPMAVLYHFKSKDGLYRVMADRLTARLGAVDETLPWETRLRDLAGQYRDLALQYPHTFGLLLRFLNTGMADFAAIEIVYRALRDAGLADDDCVRVCVGWYAVIYGLAIGETKGLIRAATPEELSEVEAMPAHQFPLIRHFMPLFRDMDAGSVHTLMVDMLSDGIRRRAASAG